MTAPDNYDSGSIPDFILEDFAKSGIKKETLLTSEVNEVSAIKCFTNLTFDKAYMIPFFNLEGDHVIDRYRIFPPLGDGIKYLQPKGKPTMPYYTPLARINASKTSVPLWITEGEKKALKLYQEGETAIALTGIWCFRDSKSQEADFSEDIKNLSLRGRTVYLAFDSDLHANLNVQKALYELAVRLETHGAHVHIAHWKPEEGKGIDDYLVFKEKSGIPPKDSIAALKSKSEKITRFFREDHREAMLRALTVVNSNDLSYKALLTQTAKKLHVKEKDIIKEINHRRQQPVKSIAINKNERQKAMAILKNPDLLDIFTRTCHTQYLGRDELLIILKLATVSRHFKRGVNIFVSGTSSVGKSRLVETVLQTVSPDSIEDFSRITPSYLEYRQDPINNKIIVFYEMNGSANAAQVLRSAITEGKIRLGTVTKDDMGNCKSRDIVIPSEGMVVITTFASGSIDYELSTRVINIELTHDPQLQREVYRCKASGLQPDEESFKTLQIADSLLENLEVFIPFADKLADAFPTAEERFNRDFDSLLNLLKASALLHQYQRPRDSKGRIIAQKQDYEIVWRLRTLISASVSPISEGMTAFLNKIREIGTPESPPTRETMMNVLSLSEATIKRRIKSAVKNDYIETSGKGKKQTLTLIYIPESIDPLPSPDKIFPMDDDLLDDFPQTGMKSQLKPAHPPLNGLERFEPNQSIPGFQTEQPGEILQDSETLPVFEFPFPVME